MQNTLWGSLWVEVKPGPSPPRIQLVALSRVGVLSEEQLVGGAVTVTDGSSIRNNQESLKMWETGSSSK